MESYYFYASGKSVEVIVELDCPEDADNECCVCAKHKTCTKCRQHKDSDKCHWDKDKKMCTVGGLFDFDIGKWFSHEHFHRSILYIISNQRYLYLDMLKRPDKCENLFQDNAHVKSVKPGIMMNWRKDLNGRQHWTGNCHVHVKLQLDQTTQELTLLMIHLEEMYHGQQIVPVLLVDNLHVQHTILVLMVVLDQLTVIELVLQVRTIPFEIFKGQSGNQR